MQLCLDAACGSSIGKVRTNNEDNYYFNGETLAQENAGYLSPLCMCSSVQSVCFGVFDGMGGAADGQIASYLAARSFQNDCQALESMGILSGEFFLQAIAHMNDTVCQEAEQRRNNMGTTAVILGVCHDQIYICNVGDSRAYRFRDGELTQITIDHVAVLPPELQEEKRRKPGLSQCIGIPPEELHLEPYIAEGILESGDMFVLCSDGLTDMLSDAEIASVLSGVRDAERCVDRLIMSALDHGGRDNVTVIVIRAEDESEG